MYFAGHEVKLGFNLVKVRIFVFVYLFDFIVYLCFSIQGRAPPRNTMVDLNSGNIDVPPNMTSWPSFHNGVAAGLKIAPASQVSMKLQHHQALCSFFHTCS